MPVYLLHIVVHRAKSNQQKAITVVQSFSNCAALSKSWLQVRIYKVRNDSLNCNTRKHNLNSVLEYSHIPARQEIFPETKTKEFERGFYCINWKY